MCCCKEPNVNGTPNVYSWDGKSFSTRRVDPPTLGADDELIYDLPGRCGGTDSHSYHLRMVKSGRSYSLLVRHGAGDERLPLGRDNRLIGPLELVDDTARYWFLMRFFHVHTDAVRDAIATANAKWMQAALEKRIKTRRGKYTSKVWIEPKAA